MKEKKRDLQMLMQKSVTRGTVYKIQLFHYESVSPVLRPFGLRFSNKMCVCWSSVGG